MVVGKGVWRVAKDESGEVVLYGCGGLCGSLGVVYAGFL